MENEYVLLVCVIDPQKNSVLATLPLAGYPEAVAFNPVDHKVYLAGEDYLRDEGVITVIDAVGDTFLSNIALGPIPSFLAYDADDDLLFAPGPYGDYVLAIDGKTDRVVDSCRVSESPVGLMYNESQHRVYSFGDHGEVTTFAPRAPRHSNYISLGAELRCFVLDASGTELYYGRPNSETLRLFDCVAESLAGGIPVPLPPTGLSYDSQHDQVYCVYGEEHSGMSIIDCSKHLVRAIVEVDAQRLYWDSGADDVYCLTDTSVTVVDGATRRVIATLETGLTLGAASVPGVPRVYVAERYEPYLTVVRTDEWPQVRALPDEQATVVRGRLDWSGTLAVMYDKCGRRVADVHRGGNDVSGLQPGVYFVRQGGVRPGTYARKVVITS
jgi:DNA-binding beta-propeller fold protein YncE